MKLDTQPKYKIGQRVKFNSWTESGREGNIVDLKVMYHRRMYEYVWGYKLDVPNGLTYTYIPQGYITEVVGEQKEVL